MGLDLYSTTPASNDLLNYFQTGMRPSAVKTAGWDIMADMAQLFNATPAGGGTANAQTLTNPRPFASLTTGLTVIFNPTAANTGAATFAPDGLTAKNVFANGAALVGGELQPGVPAILKYDGTQWNLLNPYFTGYGAASGTNTITATVGKASAYFNGMSVSLKMANTTTGAATLNVNSIGALNMYYADGVTQLAAGALIQNGIYDFIYNSSLNSGAGGWICANPSRVTGSFTGTGTGFSGTAPTATITYRTDASFTLCALVFGTGMTGTSNATSFTITGMPSSLTPAQTQAYYCTPLDSSSATTGSVIFTASSAIITLAKNAVIGNGVSNWTSSGTKAFATGPTSGQNSAITFVIN